MTGFLVRGAFAMLGLWAATLLIDGLRIDGPTSLVIAALVLGVVNAVIRPLAILLTLPLTLLTLGLFLLVINALMVSLVAWLVPGVQLSGFWAAFFTGIVVTIVGMIGDSLRPR